MPPRRELTQRRATSAWSPNNHRMDPIATPAPSEGAARRAAQLVTPRLAREQETMAAMMRIYCADHHRNDVHGAQGLCPDCDGLLEYARKRLAGCPFGPDKPTCVNCRIHCYGPGPREAVRQVMRYAGPRMMLRHPLLALAHLRDGRRPAPPKPRGTTVAKTAANPRGKVEPPSP